MAKQSLPFNNSKTKICSIDGCSLVSDSRGWCRVHYGRWRRTGNPRTPLSRPPASEDRFWLKVTKTDGCWLWVGASTQLGYGTLTVKGKVTLAHRYSFFLHNGHWPEPMCLHSCDNPPCVNPQHLREGTSADNARDAVERGRMAGFVTDRHSADRAKLTEQDVREIRDLYARGGLSTHKLAKMYGVTPTPIKQLIRRKTWKHII